VSDCTDASRHRPAAAAAAAAADDDDDDDAVDCRL